MHMCICKHTHTHRYVCIHKVLQLGFFNGKKKSFRNPKDL